MIESSVHLNSEYDWDGFCAQEYYEHNYRDMRGDDRAMLEVVCGWFQKAAPGGEVLRAVDVGAGANLYPALSLLPHSAQITLYEYSSTNVEWLEESKRHLPESWRPFADLVCPGEDFESIRKQAFTKFEVQKGSIFELPVREWEIGTMFFVAESLTEDEAEFRTAMGHFLGALKPGAPFAAAFMERSQGYDVAGTHFPAVWLDEQALELTLSESGLVEESRVYRFDIDPAPIRAGYTGYLVATGKVKG
ncbi:hypothetical protein KDL01_21840 [Actinospica durhamensis]|uniref:Methyltransferase n=1 Tax=Actinospica durhamensis TaxID=1508375 RepID=A0A941IS26_9ACTN|nr:SCO2525 family SAM-dependent methyltransferase [Actinospica durhamensis]MBR7835932.1 hypothetical protein [Actinospica durhamensis]